MNIRVTLLAPLLCLAGVNIYFYSNNHSLQKDLISKKAICHEWLSKLAKKNINNAVVEVENKTQTKFVASNPNKMDEVSPTPETDIERLASHTHRMQAVNHKYEFLILSAQIEKSEKKILKRLLLQRERLSNQLVVAEQEEQNGIELGAIEDRLYNVEDQIELVLNDPLDYHRYELIKQRQL